MAKGKYQQWLEPENLLRITNWAANGCTYSELAKNMGIGERTLYDWLEKHPQILQAIKEGLSLSCQAVENALFKRATGYDVEDVDEIQEFKGELRDGKPANGTVTKREARKTRHIPPDTGAIIFYLKNRMGERYTDRRVVETPNAAPTVVLGVKPGRADG